MKGTPEDLSLSSIDEERFGFRVARATIDAEAALGPTLDFCREKGVRLLLARSPSQALHAVQALEKAGAVLTETTLLWGRDPQKDPVQEGRSFRPLRIGEEQRIREVAARSFEGYGGHYQADRNLDARRSHEVYVDWAYRCCMSREVADEVLVGEVDGEIVAFLALRMLNPEDGRILLAGTLPEHRSVGVIRSLGAASIQWAREQGASRLITATEVNNVGVAKPLVRLGFAPYGVEYTLHLWFDEVGR